MRDHKSMYLKNFGRHQSEKLNYGNNDIGCVYQKDLFYDKGLDETSYV